MVIHHRVILRGLKEGRLFDVPLTFLLKSRNPELSLIMYFVVQYQCKRFGKYLQIDVQVIYSIMVISDVNRPFIPNKIPCIKYCTIQWIQTLPGSSENHWVRQFLLVFTGLAEIVNTTFYKTEAIFTGLGHGKSSYFNNVYFRSWSTMLCRINFECYKITAHWNDKYPFFV